MPIFAYIPKGLDDSPGSPDFARLRGELAHTFDSPQNALNTSAARFLGVVWIKLTMAVRRTLHEHSRKQSFGTRTKQ